MIKKEYVKPEVTMVKIQQVQMLCGSLTDVTTTGLGDDNLNYEKGSGDMSGAMVKGSYNVWDDDWSE